ncbi:MAG: hypothetical protein WC906_00975 [Parcubacteria group bacterium]|jgi:hypothetical protein
MRRLFIAVLFVAVALASMTQVSAEELVPLAPTATVVVKGEPVPPAPVTEDGIATKVFNKVSGLLKSKDTETAKAFKEALKKREDETAEAYKKAFGKKDTETATALRESLAKKDTETAKSITDFGNKAIRESNSNTYLLIALFVIGLGSLGALVYFRTGRIEKKVDNVPKDTAEEIYGFDPRPFNFVVKANGVNHRVICSCADEEKETYNTFQIDSMPDGPDYPESFVRQAEPKKALAKRYVKGTMKKFFEDKLKGTPQETLIVFLKDATEKLNYT